MSLALGLEFTLRFAAALVLLALIVVVFALAEGQDRYRRWAADAR
jgi:hypothetical protein